MDMDYWTYIDFVNHLWLQEFADFDYHFGRQISTSNALEVV